MDIERLLRKPKHQCLRQTDSGLAFCPAQGVIQEHACGPESHKHRTKFRTVEQCIDSRGVFLAELKRTENKTQRTARKCLTNEIGGDMAKSSRPCTFSESSNDVFARNLGA